MNAAFFDLDGTLFDTRVGLAATINHTRRDLGLAEMPQGDIIVHVGQGARHFLEFSIPEAASMPQDALWNTFMSHYVEHSCDDVTPYSGVLETLEALAARGTKLGVNTNKPNSAARRILEHFGLTRLFGEAVIAGGDGFPLKPDPASIRACADRLGHVLTPDDWMIGDNWTDMRCAEAAGVRGAFCTFGFGRLLDAPYTVKIDRMDDLLRLC